MDPIWLSTAQAVCSLFSSLLRRCAAIAMCCCAVPAVCAPAPAFSALFQQVERTAPRLRESAARVDAAIGRLEQAGAWANPSLSLEIEDFAGHGSYRGTSQAQTTLSLSEPLEIGGQRGARIAAARAELDVARARQAEERCRFGADLALAYAVAEAAQERMRLLADDVARAQEDVRSSHALVAAGKEAELRSVQADAAAAISRAELEAASAAAEEALARLSALSGTGEPYTAVADSILRGMVSPPRDVSSQRPAITPELAIAQAEQALAQQRLAVERKRRIPVPSLSVGARRLEGAGAATGATVMVAGLSLPLPLFDRNRGEIAASMADLRGADSRLDGSKNEADALWASAIAQVRAAVNRVSAYEQGESAASEAYRLVRIGYEAGRSSLLELMITRRALIDAQLRALDARVDSVRSEATLARLTGRVPFLEP